MVPSGLNKELYLPLPVPSACPHNQPPTYTPLHAANTPPAARYTPEAASRQPARLLPVSRGTRQQVGLGPVGTLLRVPT